MKRLATLAVVLAAVIAAPSASAQVTYPHTYVFVTVDAIEMDAYMSITGVQQGEAQASTVSFAWTFNSTYSFREECGRLALLAMGKPGQYLFQVRLDYASAVPICKLTRVNP